MCGCPKPRHRHCINTAALEALTEQRADWASCSICKQTFNRAPCLLPRVGAGWADVGWSCRPHCQVHHLHTSTAGAGLPLLLPAHRRQQRALPSRLAFQSRESSGAPCHPCNPCHPPAVDDRTKAFLQGAASQAPELQRVRGNIHELYKNSFELQASRCICFCLVPLVVGCMQGSADSLQPQLTSCRWHVAVPLLHGRHRGPSDGDSQRVQPKLSSCLAVICRRRSWLSRWIRPSSGGRCRSAWVLPSQRRLWACWRSRPGQRGRRAAEPRAAVLQPRCTL